jgi:hypothetical protein
MFLINRLPGPVLAASGVDEQFGMNLKQSLIDEDRKRVEPLDRPRDSKKFASAAMHSRRYSNDKTFVEACRHNTDGCRDFYKCQSSGNSRDSSPNRYTQIRLSGS